MIPACRLAAAIRVASEMRKEGANGRTANAETAELDKEIETALNSLNTSDISLMVFFVHNCIKENDLHEIAYFINLR